MSEAGEPVFDVAVLGAGAAGLVAGIRAAELGARVAVLEKNRRPGVKILMSGGTRCNITNARGLRNLRVVSGEVDPGYNPADARGAASIMAAFGAGGPFLRPALKAFSVEQSVSLFEAEGVATKVEANGKIFPVSDKAVDVLDALMRRLERSGATLFTHSPVSRVECTPVEMESGTTQSFLIESESTRFRARRVILAMGGQSFPGCGTTGDGFAIARTLGHSIIEPRPALVPLKVGPEWVNQLRGITVPDAMVRVVDDADRSLMDRRESLLFAHFGFTGPAILDVSRAVARDETDGRLRLRIDFVPEMTEAHLNETVAQRARQGRPSVINLMPDALPRRLSEALLNHVGIPTDRTGPELTREQRQKVILSLKRLSLPITGTLGFAKAEVTSGGVSLEEVNPETLESKIQPGFFFCGEVLDLDGRIGGYNFQAAWSTGWLAGQEAAKPIEVCSSSRLGCTHQEPE